APVQERGRDGQLTVANHPHHAVLTYELLDVVGAHTQWLSRFLEGQPCADQGVDVAVCHVTNLPHPHALFDPLARGSRLGKDRGSRVDPAERGAGSSRPHEPAPDHAGEGSGGNSARPTTRPTTDPGKGSAVVVGGGVIGRTTAWRAAQHGFDVTLVEPSDVHSATRVAAGMLTPATEAVFGEETLVELCVRSARMYPDFVTEVEAASGMEVGHRTTGTLLVAFDRDDMALLGELHEFQQRLGITTERLTGRRCR